MMTDPVSAYIAFEAFPRPKGASTHMASMIHALRRAHGPVLLICLGMADMPAYQEEPGVIIVRCKAYHPNMLKRAELFGDFVAKTLLAWQTSIKLCVFRDPWGGFPALSTGIKARSLFEVNALPSWELGYTYPQYRLQFGLHHKIMDLEQACLDRCTGILTVSDVTAEALRNKGVAKNKITTIKNAASLDFFGTFDESNLPEDMTSKRWMGYMGSLHPWQGVENAVRAFALIADDNPDVHMVMVTGGRKDNRKALRKLIRKQGLEDRVVVKHPLGHDSLSQVIKRCEFSLAPLRDTFRNTRQGCCPVKIIESMAAGVPVIASDLSVTRALIDHTKNGWLVPPDRIRPLALAMNRLLNQPHTRSALADHAGQKARKDFHPETIHHHLSECFDSMINCN